MLRTNLSTRPFYNERAVHVLLGDPCRHRGAGHGHGRSAGSSALSRYKTELNTAISRDRDEIDRRTREAADIRRGMNPQELARRDRRGEGSQRADRAAHVLVDRALQPLEATLPENVMLTAVRPEFKDGATHVNMDIQGRRAEDNDAFFEKLEATGVFRDVVVERGDRHRGRAAPHDDDGGLHARASGRAPGGHERAEGVGAMTLLRRVLAEKRRSSVLAGGRRLSATCCCSRSLVFPLGRQVASAEQDAQMQREALRRARQDAASAKRDRAGQAAGGFGALQVLQGRAAGQRELRERHHLPPPRRSSRSESNLRLEHGTNVVKQEKGSSLQKVTTTYMLTRGLPRRAPVHLLARDGAGVHGPRERRALRAARSASAA